MHYLERQMRAMFDDPDNLLNCRRPDGTVSHACVQHDDWCPLLKGEHDCTCDPDILVLTESGRRYEINRDGRIIRARSTLRCIHGFEKA